MSDTKMETYFSFIKECLLTFEYPLAHSMSEEELAEIFQVSNRCFLICWMLKLLDSAYEEFLENSENDKEALSNIIYELGFCTEKEKIPFMVGDLPKSEQVKIIFNMFTFIMDIKKCNSEEVENVSNDDVVALINTNLNLFPMYGDIKVWKPPERSLKLAEFEKELANIKTQVSTNTETKAIHLINNKFSDDIVQFLDQLKMEFPEIKAFLDIRNRNKDLKVKDIIEIHPKSTELFRECNESLKIISQFIKDVNTIEEFAEGNCKISEQDLESNNEIYNMVKSLYQEVLGVRSILGPH